jgi:hypothetical protein
MLWNPAAFVLAAQQRGTSMKRDLDLVRAILLDIEARGTPLDLIDPDIDGYNELEISYHVMLLEDSGIIRAMDRTAIGIFRWSAGALTWRGHELVEYLRDDKLWEAAKADLLAAADGGLPFDMIQERLRELVSRRLD